jgi:phosphohistidine phosphatase
VSLGRELFVLRHGKSDWDADAAGDFDRPLAPRGKRDCRTMASWCAEQGLMPDVVICSPAERAADTARRFATGLGLDEDDIHFDERLYLADLDTILDVLAGVPDDAHQVVLVGHNPGLDQLVIHLHGAVPRLSRNGKLMTTAAVARFAMPEDWSRLPRGGVELIELMRPKELSPR